ncbi:hypothetical protein V6N13_012336 [Hibiscus sabdariffa]|uniref:Uncharacterized protein n=1 Tax=Hibiscus sabdariffa TaxID=183260 RepID=A0ABR2SF96_9ROSI
MKKEAKPRNVIFTFLLKAVSAVVSVGFRNPLVTLSLGRDKRATSAGKALLPGPTISIIPDEARRKSKSETHESASPKVSCVGQIKHKKKAKRNLRAVSETESTHKTSSDREVKEQEALSSKKELGDDESAQVKRFTSCGDGFEWTTQIAAGLEADHPRYYCFDEDEEVIVTLSLKPRKEINIWKKRRTNPPTPLQLNSSSSYM